MNATEGILIVTAFYWLTSWDIRRRILKSHAEALKKMQTALWNDRQLRLGRTPSTTTGKTIPLPENGEKSV